MGFLAILNAGIAFTRVVLTVGVNVPITSGEETGISKASWNVCEEKKKACHLNRNVMEKVFYLETRCITGCFRSD